ncbi:Vegetative incompatibility protein HET-E-1 [Ceratobasidium theobromae]|uniref:Vegetative incompatibility protein HET-E-1 n=1 Tax=Ceratobasidium theobromae TaxID=1582974 RepID=A0A5N5QCX7_9AGAM|nr:Vegetative incompatibility protein HET-E-1 [Ceratobasidium theobromae]
MELKSVFQAPARKRRRWYHDLGQKIKQKLPEYRSGPSRISYSRPCTPSLVRPPSPGLRDVAWRTLQATLQGLKWGVELAPPLRSAIDSLTSFLGSFEETARQHQDFQQMASDLDITLQFLKRHLDASTSTEMTETIEGILRAIHEEVGSVRIRRGRGVSSRILAYVDEDMIRHYRRIEQQFHRPQLEVGMGSWHASNTSQMEKRLENLGPARLAIHNSKLSEELDRRTCIEDTRKVILSDLNAWSDNPDANKVFWVNGMAGTGKTTIACTLSEILQLRGQLAATFFCSRNSPECRDANRIIPTIVYQLARHSTPFKFALSQVMERNPDAASANISTQFEQLLKDPLQEVEHKLANNLVIVIDALDECENSRVSSKILDMLFQFAESLPVKFFITSRPEPTIREEMMSPENTSQSILHLHDIEQSLVREDVEVYLQKELEFMSPSLVDVKRLATLAGNLFIYAATAVRYIRPDTRGVDHHERLATMLAIDSESQKFAQIDGLYTAILCAALDAQDLELKERERMERVLWTAVCIREPISLGTLAALAGLRSENQALAALEPFRSVLHISERTGLISTLHASFSDFIFTQHRSGRFFCDESAYGQLLARRCLEVMKAELQFNICDLPSSSIPDSEVPDLTERIERNVSPRLSVEPEGMHSDGRSKIGEGTGMASGRDTAKLASDAHKFVARFAAHAITLSTPHIYISALPLCPPTSLVSVCYRSGAQGLMQIKGTAIFQLGQAALATWTTPFEIFSAAYSPSGAHVASGSGDGSICIRNVHDGRVVLGPFRGHSSVVLSTKFSPDGTCIASGSDDRTIRVWDARDGSPVAHLFGGHTKAVTSVAFSPDGNQIVSGSDDSTLQVWDARSGTPIAGPFQGHTACINSAGYSPDGAHIVSGSNDYTIRLWDANTRALLVMSTGHTSSVTSVGFSPDGERIISGSSDCTIRVWNVCDGTLALDPLEGHTRSIESVAYSPNGELIASGSSDQTIRVWNAHEGTPVTSPFQGHTDAIYSVGFSPGGAQIISSSRDRSIRVWNVFNNHLATAPPKGHSSTITSAMFSPNGALIASGSWDQTIRVWSAIDGTPVAGPFQGHTRTILSLAFSSNSTRIVSGSADCTVRVWHARNGTLTTSPFVGHRDYVRSVAFSPDGSRVASGADDRTIRVWDSSNGTLVAGPFEGHTNWVYSVAFSPNGRCIASGSSDGTIRIWSSIDGKQIADPFMGHKEPVSSVCFSSDGSHIVSGSWDRTARVWDARRGMLVAGPFEGHTHSICSVAFSPDNTLVLSGSSDCTIRLWSALDGTLAGPPLEGHAARVNSAAFSPDGSSVLSCSNDQSIRVWDIQCEARAVGELAEPWRIRDDGWVMNANSQMLFWIPAEIRDSFPRLSNRFTISPLGSLQVGFEGTLVNLPQPFTGTRGSLLTPPCSSEPQSQPLALSPSKPPTDRPSILDESATKAKLGPPSPMASETAMPRPPTLSPPRAPASYCAPNPSPPESSSLTPRSRSTPTLLVTPALSSTAARSPSVPPTKYSSPSISSKHYYPSSFTSTHAHPIPPRATSLKPALYIY